VERTILCLKDAPTAVRPAPIQRQMRPKPVRFDRPLDAAAVPAAAPSAAAAPADPVVPADQTVPADPVASADPVVPEAPAAEKPAEKADAADESLPIGETLNILDETKDFEETLQSLNTGVSDSANLLHQQQMQPGENAAEHDENRPADRHAARPHAAAHLPPAEQKPCAGDGEQPVVRWQIRAAGAKPAQRHIHAPH